MSATSWGCVASYLTFITLVVCFFIGRGHEDNVPEPTDAELEAWAEQWVAEHVDPYLPQIEGSDFALWDEEMQS